MADLLTWLEFQLSFAFVRNALWALFFLSIAFAPISVFVVTRRLSLSGEAMTHATLPGVVVGKSVLAAFGFGLSALWLGLGGFLTLVIATWLAVVLSWRSLFRQEALLGAVFALSFSLGVFLLSVVETSFDLQGFIQGSVLGIRRDMIWACAGLAGVSWAFAMGLYRPLVLQTQDPDFAASIYPLGWLIYQGFMALFALVLLLALITFGTLLAVAASIFPALAARCWSNRIPVIMALSFLVLLGASFGGLFLSLLDWNWPSAPTIVLVMALVWLISYALGPLGLRHSLNSASNRG